MLQILPCRHYLCRNSHARPKLWLNVALPLCRAILLLLFALHLVRPALVWGQEGARRDDEKAAPAPPTLTAPPELIEAAAPEYPTAAAAAGESAAVKVRIRIEADGSVSTASVVTPVGQGFDEAALAAVRQYRFKAAEWDGVPGAIVVETTIHFVMESVPAPSPDGGALGAGGGTAAPSEGAPERGGDLDKPLSISGVALERGTRRKLAGVIVSISELGVDVVTDAEGRFYFHGGRSWGLCDCCHR